MNYIKDELRKEIDSTYQSYKQFPEFRDHYELYIQLLLQNETRIQMDNCFDYWEALKNNSDDLYLFDPFP